MKKFSKIKLYQNIGFIHFKYEERIKKKPFYYVKSLIIVYCTVFVLFRNFASILFDKNDEIQFHLTSWFYYLEDARFYLGLVCTHCFNLLNLILSK